ncbi:hypothetical protein CMI48_03840 [Candidatus Pacearchaeota archaeon]|nr:hypothetical protein [Candidatus Pacearchaeota archaeon]|tara:strand:- start:528 stop:773 length:246 start_codon:yes stop_codon:yes gene_type:complete
MYQVELTKLAKQFLKKLSQQNAELILKKVHTLRDNPFPKLKKLKGSKLWRLRIANYRAVIDVIISGKKIRVLRIGHRKNIY